MSEEVNYASVVFKSSKQAAPEAKKEEETVYDEVKVKSETTEQTADTNDEKENNKRRHYQRLACCLGILCVVLLVGLVAGFAVLSTLSGEKQNETTLLANLKKTNKELSVENDNLTREQNNLTEKLSNLTENNNVLEKKNTNLTTEYQDLKTQKQELENQNQKLTTQNQELENQRNNLTQQTQDMEKNWEEGNISRAQWSVDNYCRIDTKTVRECTACRNGWLFNQSNCYVYHDAKPEDQLTWEKAREYCRENNADLTVAHTKKEKDIIDFYSKGTGFWIGLKVEDGSWTWIDGTKLSQSSWIGKPAQDHCAVSVQGQRQWSSALCEDKKQWICVQKGLSV